jgi:hypothetical protein
MLVALRLDGLMFAVSLYWVFHAKVIALGPFMVTVPLVPVPDEEPEYPVHTHRAPEPMETGEFTENDADLPLSYQPAPFGEP